MTPDFLVNGPITGEIIADYIARMEKSTEQGAHSLFLGQVRADIKGLKRVKAIEYSAYEKMTSKEGENIIGSLLKEFEDVKNIRILHSTGVVMAGKISLLVVVSAGHRHQAMAACTRAVELIKERLPVWKKEIFEDNTHEWKGNELA
jgi:molybdopterin synthase catalytic subunit